MALSDFALRSAKPREKVYRLSDGDGLFLLVKPNGSKLWQLRYKFQKKENVLSFGKYPIVSLVSARRKRDDAKILLSDGIDPAAERRREQIAAADAAETTFGLVAEEYIARLAARGAASATLKSKRRLLTKLAGPLFDRPIADITPAEILSILQRVENSGRHETARRLRGAIGSVFRFAIVTLRAKEDPTVPLHGALMPVQTAGRAAITDERKLGAFLRALDGLDGWPTIGAGLRFLILTCVRPGEVRGAVRSEFDFDKAVWRSGTICRDGSCAVSIEGDG